VTVNKEDVLIWLTQLGKDWVGLTVAFRTFVGIHEVDDVLEFWEKLESWHDGAYITKRYADAKFNPAHASYQKHESIEQYKLTNKAIRSLEE
jgi:HEPN domain-containing protein